MSRIPLRDRVLAWLSLASHKGYPHIPLGRFYKLMQAMSKQFPEHFVRVDFGHLRSYSKALDTALHHWVGYGVDLVIEELDCIEVTHKLAQRHLAWLREKYGTDAVAALEPSTDYLVELLKTHDQ